MIALLFDTETHDKDEPEIVEAGWLEISFGTPTRIVLGDGGKDTPTIERFKPSKAIALGALATHHIMEEDLIECRPSAEFYLPACDYLIGHNIDFDWTAAGKPTGVKRIDTCSLARDIWPDLDCYSQSALLYHLDRQHARQRLNDAHSAGADILICKTILDAIIGSTSADSWEELWEISEAARIPKIMGFGKHKGMPIKQLPRDYVSWLLRATDPPIDEYLRIALTKPQK